MVLATMINKESNVETLLIDKYEVDQLRANLEEAETENIGLNVQLVLLQTDLNCLEERYNIYDSNILCKGIIWIHYFVQRMTKFVVKKIKERKEDVI